MKIQLKDIVGYSVLAMSAAVTVMAYFLTDKTYFVSLSTLWTTGGVAVLIQYFFGNSHKDKSDDQAGVEPPTLQEK